LGKNYSSKACNSKHVANKAEKVKNESQDENIFSKTDEVI